MRQDEWRGLLQSFWANGYDLAAGKRAGWLTAEILNQATPEWLRHQLSQLPRRANWSFYEPARDDQIQHLMDQRVHLPQYPSLIENILEGAEAGARTVLRAWGWTAFADSPVPLISAITPWPHILNRLGGHTLTQLIDDASALRPLHGGSSPSPDLAHTESTRIFSIALLNGLLWPGWFERAHRENHRWAPWATGEARATARWITHIITGLPWNYGLRSLELAADSLPATSQVKAFIHSALRAYHQGTSYHDWLIQLAMQAHYYPATHAAPNASIITAALHWGDGNWNRIMDILLRARFDSLHNALIAGALAKSFWPPMTIPDQDDAKNLRETLRVIPNHPALLPTSQLLIRGRS